MNVRHAIPRTSLVLILLLLMLLSGISVPTMAGPRMPAALPPVAPAAAQPATGTYHLNQEPNVAQPVPAGEAVQAARADDSSLAEDAKQGFVTLDVDVASSFKAGSVITYTYQYENTSEDVIARDVAIDVTWSRFATEVKEDGQYCFPNPEICSVLNVSGPSVSIDEGAGLNQDVPDGFRVLIDELEPGESGEFDVQVRTGFELAPISGRGINQLDGSGTLYVDFVADATESLSESSTSTTAVGPRFSIFKRAATDMPESIFAGDEYTFVLTVGNASESQDQTNEGQPRADAIDATNVRIRDVLPTGSTFITPTQGYAYDFVYDEEAGYVEWYVPRLALEQKIDLLVKFQKLDVPEDCNVLDNDELWVTSDEMPINNDNEQLVILSRGIEVPVVTPLQVDSSFSPRDVLVDETTLATFTVLNRYTRGSINGAIQNVQLAYQIPNNVSYVADSASPRPSAIDVVPGEPGGIITWTFDIDAAPNPDQPVVQGFSLELTGVTPGNPDGGIIGFALDDVQPDIPTACMGPIERIGPRVIADLIPLDLTKTLLPSLNPGLQTDPGGTALIKDGDVLTYTIQLLAPQDIPNIDIVDVFPPQQDVRFEDITYLGDTPIPELAEDERSVLWSQQSIRANEPLSLTYRARVGGGEYIRYCNRAIITDVPTTVERPRDVDACYEIRPEIQVTKEASTNVALPNETVAFTLTLANNWDEAYAVELVDALRRLEFVSATSPTMGDGNLVQETNIITWSATLIQPGDTVRAFVTARVPNSVEKDVFRNDMLFRYFYTPRGEWLDSPGNRRQSVEIQRPSTDDTVEYSHTADREFTGLQEEFNYRLFVNNRHGVEPMENVDIEQVLPAGFTYQGMMTGDRLIDTEPELDMSRPDGRVVLRWNLDLAAEQQAEIRFQARSGATVGAKESWLQVSTEDTEATALCREIAGPESCRADGYATARIEIRALHTLAPRAVDPLPACWSVDEDLNYRVSFVNNSAREYVDTTLAITLPNSLMFTGNYGGVDAPPEVTQLDQGSVVTWDNLVIAPQTQRDIDMTLDVVSVDTTFVIQVAANSPTGIIPPENQTGSFLIDPCAELERIYLPLTPR